MPQTALTRAERLFSRGRYSELLVFLEPMVAYYRDSWRFYYYLGVSCLYEGDFGGAHTYLNRAFLIQPGEQSIKLAIAALELRRRGPEEAIKQYLRILEDNPHEKNAKSALSLLRRHASTEGLAALIESGKVKQLYPRGTRSYKKVVIIGLALALLVPLGVLAGPQLFDALIPQQRPAIKEIALDKKTDLVNASISSQQNFLYILTSHQIISTFEKAKNLFQQYRDNAALVEINRLLLSNATDSVKAKAESLKAYVSQPDFRTLRDIPGYEQVAKDPLLYRDCAIIWKGMAANLNEKDGVGQFGFLVGYDKRKVLLGIASARAHGLAIPLDRPLEILARIEIQDSSYFLSVIAVHELPKD